MLTFSNNSNSCRSLNIENVSWVVKILEYNNCKCKEDHITNNRR